MICPFDFDAVPASGTGGRVSRPHTAPLVGLLLLAGLGASATDARAQRSEPRVDDLGVDARAHADARGSAATDRAALEALYHATGGTSWTDGTNWLSEVPLDQWFGVETNGDGRVSRLSLGGDSGGNNLTGMLPPELGDLTALEWLVLSRNRLTGPIPSELGNLASLETLALRSNRLTGPIPPELGSLANLRWLHLWDNRLTGAIPAELGSLGNLRGLYLDGNGLTGTLPPELGSLARLDGLGLGNNPLTGAIPRNLMQVSGLRSLYISGTGVCVPADVEFQAWVNALQFFASSGLACDGLLVSFTRTSYRVTEGGNVPVTVHLSAAEPRGRAVTIPLTATPGGGATTADFAGVPSSVTFRPGDTTQTFTFEARADASADGGETVALGIGLPLPPGVVVGNPAAATVTLFDPEGVTVAFGSARYTAGEGGSVPVVVRLSQAPGRAVTIPLTATAGGGATAADYTGVPSSVTFGPADAVRTFRFEALPDADPDAGETVTLGIGLPLPDAVAAGTPAAATVTLADHRDGAATDRAALQALYWTTGGPSWTNSTNWLTDAPLDEWLGVWTDARGRVAGLDLDDPDGSGNRIGGGNNLTGAIPPELGALSELRILRLTDNGLSGPIPAELGRLGNLQGLYLSHNALTGPIPAELGDVSDLRVLELHYSRLTGAIPRNLMQLSAAFRDLNIAGTGVCVPADAEFQAWVDALPSFRSSGLTCEGLLVSFTRASYPVVEGGTVPVTVHLSAAELPGRAVTIPLISTPGGGATAADYAGVPASVTFGLTYTTRTFIFEARADASPDDGETVTLGLGEPLPPGVTAGNPATATVTLLDYDRVGRDREALEALYRATGGPNWSSRANWLSDEPLSTWAGVRTNRAGRVTRLSLDRNRLRGVLPAALGDLTALEWLDLSRNQLSGPIPPVLGRLSGLEMLYLYGNQLSGPIPLDLGLLANLEWLALFDNQLNGGIPPDLGNLARLEWLNLGSNRLTGEIPSELGILENLNGLLLHDNPLSGPMPQILTHLSALDRLNIADTGVCVPADAAFRAWVDTIADFRSSGLTCGVPVTVAFGSARYTVGEGDSLPVTVRLSRAPGRALTIALTAAPGGGATNADYAGVPPSLAFGPADVVRNFLIEAHADAHPDSGETVTLGIGLPLPDGVTAGTPSTATVTLADDPDGAATDRAVLEALYHATGGAGWTNSENWLSDAPLDQWFGVTTNDGGRVTALRLDHHDSIGGGAGNNLTGSIPPELGALADLERLWLNGYSNQLTGPVPPELGALTDLRELRLGGNQLTGPIPPELGRLASLRELDAWNNQLTGPIPPELGALNLELLHLGENQLTGAIPPELGSLTNLRELYLYWNRLTGPIPPELGSLTNLQELHLYGNRLTGPIPPELGNLVHLQYLDLAGNELTGSIPAELGGVAYLEYLDVGSNRLTGALPPELGRLANLEELRVAWNPGLSGRLPLRLRSPLTTVDIHFTQVCAPVDAAFEAWVAAAIFHGSGFTCGVAAPATSAIDVAVFYTPAARTGAGETAAIEAVIDLMIAETNQAYRDSGVHQRVALAVRQEVRYTEADRSLTNVLRLQDPADGHMDEVHAIRDRVGADLVHLIAVAEDVCGIARLGSYADSAFGLTDHRCGGRTFAHEIGHNMGLNHERYVACGDQCSNWPTPYSYGYMNQRAFRTGAPVESHWHTIMAYGSQCGDEELVNCVGVLRFSNPAQTWNGDPLGAPGDLPSDRVDGPADAVRHLNYSRHALSSFRTPPANRPPQPDARLQDRTLEAGAALVELAGAFWDPDGDALTYAATSSTPGVAAAAVSGSRVTVTAVSAGTATVTVTATDAGGSNTAATQTFTVTVRAANAPPEVVGVLAPLTLEVGEGSVAVEVSGAFRDRDGDGAATVTVTATDAGGSNTSATQRFAVRVPTPFTDHPIVPGVTPVKAVHFTELRAGIDLLLGEAGLPPYRWTDPMLTAGVTRVRLVHLLELREALAAAYAAAGRPAPVWTDAAPAGGTTPIRAAHLMELRAAVRGLEQGEAGGARPR